MAPKTHAEIATSHAVAPIPCRPYAVKPPGRYRGMAKGLLLGLFLTGGSVLADAPDLSQMSLEDLLAVPVVGASKYEQQQADVAAAVSVVTRDEIRAFGWRTLDEVLDSLPGIHTTYDRQYTYLGARGFGLPGDFNTRLLVTINGNRVNDVVYDSGPGGRSLPLDLDLVERIEFIPGPGGAVYGQNAMFGVINIVTRSGAKLDGAELSASYQDPQALRQGRASWGKKLSNGLDVVVSAMAMRATGEDLFFDYGAAGVAGTAEGMDGDRDEEFFTRMEQGPWSFELVYGDRRTDDPTGAYLSDPLVPGQYERDRYLLSQLQYQDALADDRLHVLARLFLGRERYTSPLSYGTPYYFTGSGDWVGGELRLLSTALTAHTLMVGLEYQENTRVDQTAEDRVDPANDLFVESDGYRVGIYGQDEWRIAADLIATLGLRVDRNDATGTQLSPRAGLIWHASTETSFKALYGRAHRAPNAYERDYDDAFSLVANPALDGETIDTFELVADHRPTRNLNLRGSVYHWTMHDLITLGLDPDSGIPQYQSGDKVEADGVEVSADKTWNRGARLRGSISYQNVEFSDGTALDNSPELLAKLNYSTPLPFAGLLMGYELQYNSERRAIDGTDLAGYWLSNLYLTARSLAPGVELSLGIYNLFDQDYEHPAADSNWQNAFEQDGRSVAAEINYLF